VRLQLVGAGEAKAVLEDDVLGDDEAWLLPLMLEVDEVLEADDDDDDALALEVLEDELLGDEVVLEVKLELEQAVNFCPISNLSQLQLGLAFFMSSKLQPSF
jgi:ATP sulfurylase